MRRTISGAFVSALLTHRIHSLTPPWEPLHSVIIANARITGEVGISGVDIALGVYFVSCEFYGDFVAQRTTFSQGFVFDKSRHNGIVDFSDASFNRRFSANGSTFWSTVLFTNTVFERMAELGNVIFADPNARVSFNGCTSKQTLFMGGATFAGSLDLIGATISGQLNLNGTVFSNEDGTIDLGRISVGDCLFLNEARARATLSLSRARVGGGLALHDAEFLSANALDLSGAVIEEDVILQRSVIAGPCLLPGATIRGAVGASEAEFRCAEVAFSLNKANVAGNAYFDGATFAGTVDFRGAQIQSGLSALDANFASRTKHVTFDLARVGQGMSLSEATFSGPTSFAMTIGESLYAQSALFRSKEHFASFSRIQVGGDLRLDHSRFLGNAAFLDIGVAKSLSLAGASFEDPCSIAAFRASRIGGNLDLTDTSFAGMVSFRRADIAGNLSATRTAFKHANTFADFQDIRILGDLSLSRCSLGKGLMLERSRLGRLTADHLKFARPDGGLGLSDSTISAESTIADSNLPGVECRGTIFGSDCSLTGIRQTDPNGRASFDGAKIRGSLNIFRSDFSGRVSACGAEIADGFNCLESTFGGKAGAVDFSDLDVSGPGRIARTRFQTPVTFTRAGFSGPLYVMETSFLEPNTPVTFTGMRARDGALFYDVSFASPAYLDGMEVARSLSIRDCNFSSTQPALLLENTVVGGDLDLQGSKIAGRLDLLGMTCRRIQVGDRPGSCGKLLELLHKTKCSEETYAYLERHMRDRGLRKEADAVFVDLKRRQRDEASQGPHTLASVALDVLYAFGREPSRVLLWCLIPVLLGCLLFRRKGMEERDPDRKAMRYSALWYSVDMFLPFVNLVLSEDWKPADSSRLARFYLPLHVLSGWFLVPIVIAAWTGLLG
ncbi:MAG TPA: pentapeptide repeat-containing protein [Phycisphaerae bacterium]|nr:pentapeptide repeat-containing protein [Phycisphaerae bacterium]